MSNVEVRPCSKENPRPEGAKDSEAEGEAFEGFDGVIAAFSKTVGQANVECVQNVGTPVGEHFAAGFELLEIQPVAGFQPEVQPAFGFIAAMKS